LERRKFDISFRSSHVPPTKLFQSNGSRRVPRTGFQSKASLRKSRGQHAVWPGCTLARAAGSAPWG